MKINTKHSASKQLLKSVYGIKKSVGGVRGSVLNYAPKLSSSDDETGNLTDRERKIRENALSIKYYWEPIKERLPGLEEAHIEVMIAFGKDHSLVKEVDNLFNLLYQLYMSISDYYRYQMPEYREQISIDERKRVYYISFDVKPNADSGNEYSERLDQAFGEVEKHGERLLLK